MPDKRSQFFNLCVFTLILNVYFNELVNLLMDFFQLNIKCIKFIILLKEYNLMIFSQNKFLNTRKTVITELKLRFCANDVVLFIDKVLGYFWNTTFGIKRMHSKC